jgi:hypothetical protein
MFLDWKTIPETLCFCKYRQNNSKSDRKGPKKKKKTPEQPTKYSINLPGLRLLYGYTKSRWRGTGEGLDT